MNIWKPHKKEEPFELEEHSYERTLIGMSDFYEKIVVWIEGTKMDFEPHKRDFGICGGNINTNTGISLSKEEVGQIYKAMKRGATLKIAACNRLDCKGVVEEFEKSNNMVKVGPNSFAPKDKVK